MTSATNRPVTSGALSRQDAEELVFEECRLLDETRYEEWLELFTEDGLYWLPISGEDDEPERGVSIVYDDAERRAERVYRTLHTPVLDQNPRSRTVHLAGNVQVLEEPHDDAAVVEERQDRIETDAGDEDTARVRCSMLIAELRPGGDRQVGLNHTRIFAGRCEYRLRRVGDRWCIAMKKLQLIDADQPLYNLAFIL